jgi:mono/diheme cytochrome c family protein
MKSFFMFAVVLMLFWAAPAMRAQKADVKAGQASYTKACASCHSADGTPKDAIAKMMKVEMRHLGDPGVQAKTDAELRKDILEGTGKMKAVKSLNDEQVANIIAFLRTLTKN